jgi:ribose transport system permease protein
MILSSKPQQGGRGELYQHMQGAIFIGLLNNGINLAGIDPYMQKVALGCVILSAGFVDQINKPF